MTESRPDQRVRWIYDHPEDGDASRHARFPDFPGWLARLLSERGIHDPDVLDAWMHPRLAGLSDPFLLPDMNTAVDRVMTAITNRERVTVFGDYDVDGITGTALITKVLTATGLPVQHFLPHRLEEGYGLSPDALQRCLAETNPALIITVDCGTGSIDAVKTAREAGIDVIITDHHTVGPDLAPAVAVVNPRRSHDETMHGLAGVGVAFKFCHALIKRARQRPEPPAWSSFDPKEVFDLVALGTIADLVPLTHENRILVVHGLKVLNRQPRCGLRALIEVAKISREIGTYEVGYLLGPRLNAAGRLGTARAALQLLLTDDPAEAGRIAQSLDAANRERQAVERAIVEDVDQRVDQRLAAGPCYSIIEADESWHPGVVGIVASRIVQKHCRPTILIGADDQGRAKGSGRSISGFNLVEALAECRDHLVKHGGHAMAAGLEIPWENIEFFRGAFEEVAMRNLAGQELVPRLRIDSWVDFADLTEAVIEILEGLGPYGIGNPEPLLGCRGLHWAGVPREVGAGHLKARFQCQNRFFDAIGFGLYQANLPPEPLDAVFHLRREVFRGRENHVLHLRDFRTSGRDDIIAASP